MFKDRTSATIVILAVLALVVMGAAMVASTQNNAVLAQQTAERQTAQAPTNDALTQVAADRQATQVVLDATSTQVAAEAMVTSVALATSAAGSDVQTTESGLQYRVVTEGDGPKPTADDTVTINYRGILQADATEFDSSYSRGTPSSFPLSRVIPGFTEGIQLMPVGSKYIFIIPPDLAYGEDGYPPVIPPSATLIFEVELLSITTPPTAAPTSEATESVAATPESTESAAATPEATAESTASS